MKEERYVPVIVQGRMFNASPITAADSPAQPPLPTPSPYSFSVASTRWNTRPTVHVSSLILRALALIFSFVSVIALAAPPPAGNNSIRLRRKEDSSFYNHSELMYSFIVNVFVFFYSAYQLFKGVCDIAHRGILLSDMISDYISFILDEFTGYLLISSSSVAVPAIQSIDSGLLLWKVAVISICMSFATFLVTAANALLSGYKLCKRIIW